MSTQPAVLPTRLQDIDALISELKAWRQAQKVQRVFWPPKVRRIIQDAADRAGVRFEGILGGGTHRKHVTAQRRLAICELRAQGHSLMTIGRWMRMHHTSVLYHLQTVAAMEAAKEMGEGR